MMQGWIWRSIDGGKMKTLTMLLMAAFLAAPLAAAKAKPKPAADAAVAPALVATPAVDKVEAEADRDLEAAKPQGEPEEKPADLSMKGRKILALGMSQGLLAPMPRLTAGWWLSERNSLRFSVAGNYDHVMPRDGSEAETTSEQLQVEAAVRSTMADLGDFGALFSQLGIGGYWQHSHNSSVSAMGGWNQTSVLDQDGKGGICSLRAGGEVFWPGRRDLSFEASWGAVLTYSLLDVAQDYSSDSPILHPAPARSTHGHSEFQLSTDFANALAAINFYFR